MEMQYRKNQIFLSSPGKTKKLYFNAINHQTHPEVAFNATGYLLIHIEGNCNCKSHENKLKYNSYHTTLSNMPGEFPDFGNIYC